MRLPKRSTKIGYLDKQHPLLASIQCHSNTTMFPNILAPPLPAKLLQFPNVNSLASSHGRNNFRSRSQRIWCGTQSMLPVCTNGRGKRWRSRRNYEHESRGKTTVDGLFSGMWMRDVAHQPMREKLHRNKAWQLGRVPKRMQRKRNEWTPEKIREA